ncbi:Cleavage factor two protein 2 [Ceratocystis lukuohia]|uniref:Cleavage and polyadenylation specificity factor subunit 2 n=2 Tax=Ceratocystis TaxID=5157 RepID=A0A0F8BLY3_CERFI|nr:Cleavage factor two protein 2 [Ceratocystis platani]
MFTFSPLQGAFSESPATQSLLELDGGVKLLVGLGWDASFDVEKLAELERQVATQSISLILLTHATVGHLAAYAHCCKNFARFTQIPVYATRPVIDLGRTLLQDLYESAPLAATIIPKSSFADTASSNAVASSPDNSGSDSSPSLDNLLLQPPSAEEIAKYFSLIQPLKYSQPHQPIQTPGTPPLNGLTITAYNSGRTLGGTIWHIQHGMESIVYAVDWNQARENVFAGAAWLGGAGSGGAEVIEQLRQPTALICSSRGATKPALSGGRNKRDEQLLETVKSIALGGGTVLIPVDSSARVLEIAYLLEHAWRTANDPKLEGIQLFLAGKSMSSTLRYAGTMLEWMDDNINREFEAINDRSHNQANQGSQGIRDRDRDDGANEGRSKSTGPFHFKYIRVLERKAQIDKLLDMTRAADTLRAKGRIILATDTTLEWGFSRDILRGLSEDPRNAIILTEQPTSAKCSNAVSSTLFSWWKTRSSDTRIDTVVDGVEVVYGGGRELAMTQTSRQRLEDGDLDLYQQWLAKRSLQSQVEAAGGAALEAAADAVDDEESDSSDSDDDSDSEQQGKSLNISAAINQANRRNVALTDEELGINILVKKKGTYDFEVDSRKGRDRFFPIPIRRKRTDDYGDLIRPEAYLRAEERNDSEVTGPIIAGTESDEETKLGKKRKWSDQSPSNSFTSSKRAQRSPSPSGDGSGLMPIDELDATEDLPDAAPASEPARLVVETVTIAVNLRIAYIDMEGIHDKRSLNMLIPLIQPRKLILIGGSADETNALASDCRRLLAGSSPESSSSSTSHSAVVLTPTAGAVVDASVDTNAWSLKLGDALVHRIKWQTVKGLSVATINGQLLGLALDTSAAITVPTKKPSGSDSDTEMDDDSTAPALKITPTLDLVHGAASASAARAMTQPLHVGDLRLAEIRRVLQMAGHAAEFRGEGILVVDGTVAVRKTDAGRIEVERVGADMGVQAGKRKRSAFAEVMRVVYDNLAVVAGA